MNTTHLSGSDEVARAGRSIANAADAIQKAANVMNEVAEKMRRVLSDFDFTLVNHQRFMTNWVQQVRDTLEEVLPDLTAPLAVRLVHRVSEEDDYQEVELESYRVLEPVTGNSDRPTMPSPHCDEGPID